MTNYNMARQRPPLIEVYFKLVDGDLHLPALQSDTPGYGYEDGRWRSSVRNKNKTSAYETLVVETMNSLPLFRRSSQEPQISSRIPCIPCPCV